MKNHTKVDGEGNVVIVDATVTINQHSDTTDKIAELRIEIKKMINSKEEQQKSLDIVDVVERELNSGSPKSSVLKPLIDALPSFGNIASIGSFLLSAI